MYPRTTAKKDPEYTLASSKTSRQATKMLLHFTPDKAAEPLDLRARSHHEKAIGTIQHLNLQILRPKISAVFAKPELLSQIIWADLQPGATQELVDTIPSVDGVRLKRWATAQLRLVSTQATKEGAELRPQPA
jgi:hypothetical protein